MTSRSASLAKWIRQIESEVTTPENGLPEDLFLFVSRMSPLVNVDLLIQDDGGRTLLTWRDDGVFGPGWHVPGGIIRYKEHAADRIRAVARQELGVEVLASTSPVLVHESIAADRLDRGHGISLLYRCRLASALDPHRRHTPQEPIQDQWEWHDGCPDNLIAEQSAYASFMNDTGSQA